MDSMVSGEGYAGVQGGIPPVRIFMLFVGNFLFILLLLFISILFIIFHTLSRVLFVMVSIYSA